LSPVLRAETMARPVMMSLSTAVPATLAKAASSCGSAKMAVAVSRSEAAVRTRARRLLVQLGCGDGEGGREGAVSWVRSKAEAVRRRGRALLVFSRVGRPPLLSPPPLPGHPAAGAPVPAPSAAVGWRGGLCVMGEHVVQGGGANVDVGLREEGGGARTVEAPPRSPHRPPRGPPPPCPLKISPHARSSISFSP
jgi:hypothetical protein